MAAEDRTNWGSFGEAWKHLCEDLNTPAALGAAFKAMHELTERDFASEENWSYEVMRVEYLAAHRLFCRALGLDVGPRTPEEKKAAEIQIPAEITVLAEKRWAAKKAKDFAAADALRKELTAAGWSMLDSKDGYKLEPVKK